MKIRKLIFITFALTLSTESYCSTGRFARFGQFVKQALRAPVTEKTKGLVTGVGVATTVAAVMYAQSSIAKKNEKEFFEKQSTGIYRVADCAQTDIMCAYLYQYACKKGIDPTKISFFYDRSYCNNESVRYNEGHYLLCVPHSYQSPITDILTATFKKGGTAAQVAQELLKTPIDRINQSLVDPSYAQAEKNLFYNRWAHSERFPFIMGHEFQHIKNEDTVCNLAFAKISVLAGLLRIPNKLAVFALNKKLPLSCSVVGAAILAPVAILSGTVGLSLLHSKYREYQADKGASDDPAVIRAGIAYFESHEQEEQVLSKLPLFLKNKSSLFKDSWLYKELIVSPTHPSSQVRIKYLTELADTLENGVSEESEPVMLFENVL